VGDVCDAAVMENSNQFNVNGGMTCDMLCCVFDGLMNVRFS
jgi:hypothetical protein